MAEEQATFKTAEQRARAEAKRMREFMTHLGTFVAVGLFFLILNLVTDPHSLWFFWPMLPWAVGLVIHGWKVFWNDRLFGDAWEERRVQTRLGREQTPAPTLKQAMPHVATTPEIGEITHQGAVLIDGMRANARQIPKPAVRQQALALCASADRVLSAIDENPDEVTLARDFLDRYLAPANKIVDDYARLATRHVASAEPTLTQVEQHDLPQLTAKFDELYDRLHRGSLIDLQAAREMLSIDIPGWRDDDEAASLPQPAPKPSVTR